MNKFFVATIFVVFLLVGCQIKEDNKNNMDIEVGLETTNQDNGSNTELNKDEINNHIKDIIITLEKNIEDAREMKISLNRLKDVSSKIVASETLNEVLKNYIYGPHKYQYITIFGGQPEDEPVRYKDVKDLNLKQVQEQYRDEINSYIKSFFGEIKVNDVMISKTYCKDNYFYYVFTKRKIDVEHFGTEKIQEIYIYNKYTVLKTQSDYKVMEIDTFYAYDIKKFTAEEYSEEVIESYYKAEREYTSYDNENIIFSND